MQPRSKGIKLETLPRPWDQVAIFLKRYITCEGRYKIEYIYDFFLHSHFCHGRLLNMPFYLLRTLQNMPHYVKTSRHPLSSITNHGLIKLLVQVALAKTYQTWERFIVGAGVNRAPVVRGIEEGDVEWGL